MGTGVDPPWASEVKVWISANMVWLVCDKCCAGFRATIAGPLVRTITKEQKIVLKFHKEKLMDPSLAYVPPRCGT